MSVRRVDVFDAVALDEAMTAAGVWRRCAVGLPAPEGEAVSFDECERAGVVDPSGRFGPGVNRDEVSPFSEAEWAEIEGCEVRAVKRVRLVVEWSTDASDEDVAAMVAAAVVQVLEPGGPVETWGVRSSFDVIAQ